VILSIEVLGRFVRRWFVKREGALDTSYSIRYITPYQIADSCLWISLERRAEDWGLSRENCIIGNGVSVGVEVERQGKPVAPGGKLKLW